MIQYNEDFLMDPKVDFVFKNIFCNEKHHNITIDLLNSILRLTNKEKIVEVEFLNPANNKNFEGDKESIFDIKAKVNNNSYINIEMQINPLNMIPRTVYYLSKLITNQLHEKDQYKDLLRSVCINVMAGNIFPDEERFHNAYLLKEYETNNILTNLMEIHFIELRKIYSKQLQIEERLRNWVMFLNDPESEEVKMISKSVKEIQAAYDVLKKLSKDEKSRELYEDRLKGLRDYVSAVDSSFTEGWSCGKKEGKKEKAISIAKELVIRGMPSEEVAKITHLSIQEIEKLR